MEVSNSSFPTDEIQFVQYDVNREDDYLPHITEMISKDLSEPYGIYVYRYFLNNWSQFCWMMKVPKVFNPIGIIICKLERHRSGTYRGYIAMLAISETHRGRGLGTLLAERAIQSLKEAGAHEIVLETEEDNGPSLRLYRKLGFIRTKHLHRYYLNGKSAFRLALMLKSETDIAEDVNQREDEENELYDNDLYG